eukprot:2967650-Amphidinium_carterae.1
MHKQIAEQSSRFKRLAEKGGRSPLDNVADKTESWHGKLDCRLDLFFPDVQLEDQLGSIFTDPHLMWFLVRDFFLRNGCILFGAFALNQTIEAAQHLAHLQSRSQAGKGFWSRFVGGGRDGAVLYYKNIFIRCMPESWPCLRQAAVLSEIWPLYCSKGHKEKGTNECPTKVCPGQ